MTAVDMNGTEELIIAHQFIAACLQRIGLPGLPTGCGQVYFGIDLAVQIVKYHAIIQQARIPQPLGHQGLRMCEKSTHDLEERQQQIDDNAHPGAFLRGGKALRCIGSKAPISARD